jgi:hypothetical protein
MESDINVKLRPSGEFIGVLAEMLGLYSGWVKEAPDWSAQLDDLIYDLPPLPNFGPELYEHPFSRKVFDDLLKVTLAIFGGDYQFVRDYLSDVHFVFVVGYPRTGGSFLTRELINTLGISHRTVSEGIAHDGFPHMHASWFYRNNTQKEFYLQDSIYRLAEFLVISRYYYKHRTMPLLDGKWVVPKKFHKAVNFGAALNLMLDRDRVDFLITCRHPLPTTVSVYEKSGGFPADGLFPAMQPRTAIECWIVEDLMALGYDQNKIAGMDYFTATKLSWMSYYSRLATSGIFTDATSNVSVMGYGKDTFEKCILEFSEKFRSKAGRDELRLNNNASRHPEWVLSADEANEAVASLWRTFGLPWPTLERV